MRKFKENRITDWRRDQALQMRNEQKMTYQQIADSMGVSKAYIGILLQGNNVTRNFHIRDEASSAYPGLTRWMNKNQVTHAVLARKMGYVTSGQSLYSRIANGRIRKDDIDKLLEITGATYEELFGVNA